MIGVENINIGLKSSVVFVFYMNLLTQIKQKVKGNPGYFTLRNVLCLEDECSLLVFYYLDRVMKDAVTHRAESKIYVSHCCFKNEWERERLTGYTSHNNGTFCQICHTFCLV